MKNVLPQYWGPIVYPLNFPSVTDGRNVLAGLVPFGRLWAHPPLPLLAFLSQSHRGSHVAPPPFRLVM
jgi:hypothetical protein